MRETLCTHGVLIKYAAASTKFQVEYSRERKQNHMIVGEVKQQESYVLLPLDKLKYQLQLNKVLFSWFCVATSLITRTLYRLQRNTRVLTRRVSKHLPGHLQPPCQTCHRQPWSAESGKRWEAQGLVPSSGQTPDPDARHPVSETRTRSPTLQLVWWVRRVCCRAMI